MGAHMNAPDTKWDYEGLWSKTKLYAQRAMEVGREQPTFALWMSLTLEFLVRSSLAKIHPALLADPREGGNILYAFGYPTTKAPRSIPVTSALSRCKVVVEGFTDDDVKRATVIVERRNEELHSGTPAFHELPTALWLADCYRIMSLLLSHLELGLADLFGDSEAEAALRMIEAAEQDVSSRVTDEVSRSRTLFQALSREDQESRATAARNPTPLFSPPPLSKRHTCPACESQGLLDGEQVSVSGDRLEDGMIIDEVVVLPTEFSCPACGLSLRSHAELHAAGLGGQYAIERSQDLADYYGAESEPDYWDYGND